MLVRKRPSRLSHTVPDFVSEMFMHPICICRKEYYMRKSWPLVFSPHDPLYL